MIARYSAAEMFGAPIDNVANVNLEDGSLIRLMESYDIQPREIPTDPTDITPYYWKRPAFRYFLALAHPEGPATVDMLPVDEDSENYLLLGAEGLGAAVQARVRHIEVPTDQQVVAIIGPGPRFPDKLSVHELIVSDEY
ncbi:hypothetical protein KC878_03340 [Candidatus Saccharibacteria bacterium]|nr:hypothetical protein [Candidatus Saccharibacteria bacterium]MCB9821411.1 hypothetical protein [Candidatus Nomurabacteria bacterium]